MNPDSTANDLQVIWIEELGQNTQQQVNRLIAYIRRRCTEGIEAAGGHTLIIYTFLSELFVGKLLILLFVNVHGYHNSQS